MYAAVKVPVEYAGIRPLAVSVASPNPTGALALALRTRQRQLEKSYQGLLGKGLEQNWTFTSVSLPDTFLTVTP